MNLKSFDIVIVGAGPAGGHCARILAKSGHKVLLAEQNDNFNKNDFSSAATPLETLSKFDLPESVIGSFWHKLTIETSKVSQSWESPESLGVVLNFAKFRAFLASEAERFGGEVWLGYRYTGHSQAKGETTVEFKQLSDGQIIKVSTKVLVDATGFARAIMYEKENDKPDFLSGTGIEYLIEVEPEVYNKYSGDLIFFLGDKWMPKGYSWIFPMEPNRLKIGSIHSAWACRIWAGARRSWVRTSVSQALGLPMAPKAGQQHAVAHARLGADEVVGRRAVLLQRRRGARRPRVHGHRAGVRLGRLEVRKARALVVENRDRVGRLVEGELGARPAGRLPETLSGKSAQHI